MKINVIIVGKRYVCVRRYLGMSKAVQFRVDAGHARQNGFGRIFGRGTVFDASGVQDFVSGSGYHTVKQRAKTNGNKQKNKNY